MIQLHQRPTAFPYTTLFRSAYNKMAHLSEEELRRGVIAASAGNHAQGVALSASRLKCRAVIVMPVTTPQVKIDAVRSEEHMSELQSRENLVCRLLLEKKKSH